MPGGDGLGKGLEGTGGDWKKGGCSLTSSIRSSRRNLFEPERSTESTTRHPWLVRTRRREPERKMGLL